MDPVHDPYIATVTNLPADPTYERRLIAGADRLKTATSRGPGRGPQQRSPGYRIDPGFSVAASV